MRVIGGCWIRWMSVAMSGLSPACHAASRIVVSRMCSRLFSGSASTPASARRLDTVVCARSRTSSASSDAGFLERRQHRHRNAGRAARRVDGELGRIAQPLDARAVLAPFGQPLLPPIGLIGGERRRRPVPPRRASSSLTQGAKSSGPEIGKRQQQVGEVALRIDHDHRHRIDGRLFDHARCRARSCRCRSCRRRGRA